MYGFCFVLLCIRGQFPSKSPWGAYIWRGGLKEGFLRYEFWWLIFRGGASSWTGADYLQVIGSWHGGAYFRNFTVLVEFKVYMLTFFFWKRSEWLFVCFRHCFLRLRLGCTFHDVKRASLDELWHCFDTLLHFIALDFPASCYSGRSHVSRVVGKR